MSAECKASISGLCLALSMGYRYCRQGECTEHEVNEMAERARQLAADQPPPERAVRRARRVRLAGGAAQQDRQEGQP